MCFRAPWDPAAPDPAHGYFFKNRSSNDDGVGTSFLAGTGAGGDRLPSRSDASSGLGLGASLGVSLPFEAQRRAAGRGETRRGRRVGHQRSPGPPPVSLVCAALVSRRDHWPHLLVLQ